MRPLKFRVWVESPDGEKAMHYPKLISFGSGQLSWATLQDDSVIKDNGWFTKREVMQFTGAQSIDEVDVYEGDLLSYPGNDYKYTLAWYEGGWGVMHSEDMQLGTLGMVEFMQVVGNIYENNKSTVE